MTYLGFLTVFLLVPILALTLFHLLVSPLSSRRVKARNSFNAAFPRENSRDKTGISGNKNDRKPAWLALMVLSGVAVVYTSPWDNYLVANRIWWYDPERIAGIVLGWVPLEEYLFFILQVLFTGLIALAFLDIRRGRVRKPQENTSSRWVLPVISGIIWLCAAAVLYLRWSPGTYLALLSLWALPPLAIQAAFGGDILWSYRGVLASAISIPTLFLASSDALAIHSGIWTINPERSLNLFLGPLPLEELLFFLTTNALIVSGFILAVSPEGRMRLDSLLPILATSKQVSSSHTKT